MKRTWLQHIVSRCLVVVLLMSNMPGDAFAKDAKTSTKSSSAPASLFIDDKGEQWIRIPQGGTNADHLVRLADATEDELFRALNNFDFKSIPGQSLKQFPAEYIKFSSALMMVQLGSCFGGTSSLTSLSLVASAATPTCLDDFLHHLIDIKGLIGFYFFMLGNRYTSTGLMKVATLGLHNLGKTKNIPQMRKAITPFLGYLGMAGGSLASQVVHHFLSAPSWGQCIDLLSEEGLTSLPCKEAYTHFLSVEDFWNDFAAGTMSMFASSAAAAVTHKILASGGSSLIKNIPALAARGLRVVGGDSKAFALLAKNGVKAIRAIRVVKNVTVATGVPGVIVFVVTQVGQIALFLAWDEVFKNPVSRFYYDWQTSGGVIDNIGKITDAAKENQKLKWERPFITSRKVCRERVYNQKNKSIDCLKIEEIEGVDPLSVALMEFNYGAQRYRKKVLQNPIDAALAGWTGKMFGALSKYKLSKTFVEFIAKEREKKQTTAMSLSESGFYILTLWRNALETELATHPKVPGHAQPLVNQLAAALTVNPIEVPIVKNEDTPARTNYYPVESAQRVASIEMNPARETAVKKALLALQDYAGAGLVKDTKAFGDIECNYLPITCLARDVSTAIDLKKPFAISYESSSSDIAIAMFEVFGAELASDATFEMLCGDLGKIKLTNFDDNGKTAKITLPKFINFARPDFDKNCYDHSTLRDKMDFVRADDILRPWILNGRLYKNAFDMLSSKDVALTVGSTKKEIESWWMKNSFTPFSAFLFQMAKQYQAHLKEYLNVQINDVTPEQLIHMSSPQKRGAALDHHIVSLSGASSRPTMALSLMGQTHFVLDTIKYYGPPGADPKKLEQLKLALARYILGVKVVPSINSMETVWKSYLSKAKGLNDQTVLAAQEEFDRDLKETVLGTERIEHIANMRQEIIRLKDAIFAEMSPGKPYDDITGLEKLALQLRFATIIEDPKEYMGIAKEDQKLFATFIMLNMSINNIVMEIDRLYDKLGAKPFTGMKE